MIRFHAMTTVFFGSVFLLSLLGCRSLVVNEKSGGEQIGYEAFATEERTKMEKLLANRKKALTLEQAIALALAGNRDLIRERIEVQLSRLETKKSLAPFLPKLDFQWTRQGFRKEPLLDVGGVPFATQDRYVNEMVYQ
ncbi:MAG: hypothetical protein D6820_13085, partial [Lentisphaerae bacterium]